MCIRDRTNAVSGIVTPADFITEDGGDANAEEGADGTATSEPPPPPPGDAGGEMGYRRR